ncbi:medium-chain acyl-CoA ligase ACSF2, mitochondrial-like [Branchiostoma floridae x Branchiostoma japonicum]
MSYLKSRSDLPLVEATLGQLLDDSAAKWPDHEAYVFRHLGVRMKLAEVKQEADRVAAGLLSIGVRRGDVVACSMGTRPEWIVSFFAAAKIGAIVLPRYSSSYGLVLKDMFAETMKKVKVKVLMMENRPASEDFPGTIPFLQVVFPEIMSATTKELTIKAVPSFTSIVIIGDKTSDNAFYNWEELQSIGVDETARGRVQDAQRQTNCHDSFLLISTSGSTGLPKIVEHSTYSFVNNNGLINKIAEEKKWKVMVAPADEIITPVLTGSQTIGFTSNDTPTLVEIATAVLEERSEVSTYISVKILHDLVNDPTVQECDMSFLTDVMVGGNTVFPTLLKQGARAFPRANITKRYGTTETRGLTLTRQGEMSKEQIERTVGRLLPHMEMKIVDKAGQVVPLNQKGEVWVRGYSVFKRYRGDEEKTAEVKTPDGWYKTGDIGVLDDDGLLAITGRIKDIIIKGDENVYPAFIEKVLLQYPKVLDVKVVSVPDPGFVEEICACIILKSGQTSDAEELKTFSEKNELVEEFTPGYFVFMESFPVTSTGRKIDKKKIRALAMERLGLKENAE